MARNKTAAQRRARKARKRAEKKRRQAARTQIPSVAAIRRQAAAFLGEQVVEDDMAWLDDDFEVEPCSAATAEGFAEDCEGWASSMEHRALHARDALDRWPEDARTAELRLVLREYAREVAEGAGRLRALAARLEVLAAREADHVHLVGGALVAPPQTRDEEDVALDDIPY